MSAEILLEQALAFVRRSFSRAEVKTCEAYGGQFSASEIAFKSYSCPAILITVLGWQPPPKDARMGAGRHVKQYRLAAFVLFEHVERTKRMTGAMALAENLGTVLRQWAPMTELQNANLAATISGLDYEPKCENMYSRAFDEARQAMFLVSWYQCAMPAVPLGPGRPAVPYSELPDLVAVEINDTVQGGQELDLSPPDADAAILVEESVDFAFLAAPELPLPPLPPAYAVGGTVSQDGQYTVHVISATQEIQVFGTLTADVLLVGSGGGAGKGNASGALGGGGGAGRFIPLTNIVIEAGVYLAVIGSPGIASNDHINERATAGGATSFLGYIAPGGGCGGNGLGGSSGGTSAFTTGGSGGSSGGNGNRPEAEPAADTIPGTGEAGYGSKGAIRGLDGSAGSGGGAGSIGTSGDTAAGGLGLFSEITGVSLEYARGGDAGSYNGSTTDAPQGRGWGGNSGGAIGGPSKNGSTGSVILRYLT